MPGAIADSTRAPAAAAFRRRAAISTSGSSGIGAKARPPGYDRRMRLGRSMLVLAVLAALLAAPPPHARDAVVRSFDGTPIVTHFFPAEGLAPGKRAPTVLAGHGYGMTGQTNQDAGSDTDLRPDRRGPDQARGLQRAHLGRPRLRRLGRPGGDRLQGLRGPRRAGADRLRRQAARGAARPRERPPAGHERPQLRRRHPARHGRDRPARGRDHPDDRVELAAHRASTRRAR